MMNGTMLDLTPSSNYTIPLYQGALPWVWNFRAIFQVTGKVFALFFNGLLVLLFYKFRTVRNPFNLYVLNLTLANLSNILIVYPFQVFNQLSHTYFTSIARCFVYRYLLYVSPGWINHAHLLIALNRFWALMFPISYRNYQQASFFVRPVFVCCVTMVYLHIILVPGVIADFIIPRFPLENYHCAFSASTQPAWLAGTQMWIHNMPLVVILLVYPFICVKMLRNPRKSGGRIGTITSKRTASAGVTGGAPKTNPDPSVNEVVVSQNNSLTWLARFKAASKNGFLTLTFLCLVVLISLTPAQIYYTLLSFGVSPNMNVLTTNFLYGLMGICDPVVFLLTVGNLRKAMVALFKRATHRV